MCRLPVPRSGGRCTRALRARRPRRRPGGYLRTMARGVLLPGGEARCGGPARAGDCVAVRRLLAGGANVSDANPNFLDSLPIHYAALVQRPAAAPRLPGMLPCRRWRVR